MKTVYNYKIVVQTPRGTEIFRTNMDNIENAIQAACSLTGQPQEAILSVLRLRNL